MNLQKQRKEKRRWQPQCFGNGNPRRGKKRGTGGVNQKQTSSRLRIPKKSRNSDQVPLHVEMLSGFGNRASDYKSFRSKQFPRPFTSSLWPGSHNPYPRGTSEVSWTWGHQTQPEMKWVTTIKWEDWMKNHIINSKSNPTPLPPLCDFSKYCHPGLNYRQVREN